MRLGMLNCCGIKEMAGISEHRTPDQALRVFLQLNYDQLGHQEQLTGAFFIFSQAGSRSHYGDKLAAYIEEHKLGEVVVVGRKRNPNSGNMVKMFVWMPDVNALKAWAKEHRS